MTSRVICFDLEGPLSPQDNALEVMGLIDNGKKIFEIISRYDDILTLESRENYEPGDTLSLIVPFLLYHDISEKDIRKISDKAMIVPGVEYMIPRLKKCDWDPYIISTSYEQHAYNIAEKIGIERKKIFCTKLPLDKLKTEIKERDANLIEEVERDILEELYTARDGKRIKERLDRFYNRDMKGTELGRFMDGIKVVGGQRKVDSLIKIARMNSKNLSEIVAVGDSITDYKMLDTVRNERGVAVVFNGNDYAIPYANFGLASQDMRFLLILTDSYVSGGWASVMRVVKEWEENRKMFVEKPEKISNEFIPDDVRNFLIEKKSDPKFMPPPPNTP
ncbi:MAG TPA: hypothetical protein EYP86_01535 [Candidatus Altiarchaeales archaeon]|nr:hypothetical protein [Candidatus Altiarchaeales archaeon]